MISKKCLACNGFQHDCIGSNLSCGKFEPLQFSDEICGKFDPAPEPETPTPTPETSGESRQDKFKRIGAKRRDKALECIRTLTHLTASYERQRRNETVFTYEWTLEDAEEILQPMEEALNDLRRMLTVPVANGVRGLEN